MSDSGYRIVAAVADADLTDVGALFRAYATSLDTDLEYQGFDSELAALPGQYAPPAGAILLARATADGAALGCVGLRPSSPDICEMKRLFVSPAGRGRGIGLALVSALLATARGIGYREVRLDTLPGMKAAQTLYRSLGFEDMAPYYETPVEGTLFMRKRL